MKNTRTISIPERIFDIVVGHLDNECSTTGDEEMSDLVGKLGMLPGKFELTENECAIIWDEFGHGLEAGIYRNDGETVERSLITLVRRASEGCTALRARRMYHG